MCRRDSTGGSDAASREACAAPQVGGDPGRLRVPGQLRQQRTQHCVVGDFQPVRIVVTGIAVDDLDASLAGLRAHGAELVGGVERYEDIYRLCYIRGPEGIIIELAERIG